MTLFIRPMTTVDAPQIIAHFALAARKIRFYGETKILQLFILRWIPFMAATTTTTKDFIDIRNGWRRDYALHCNHEQDEDLPPYIERIQANSTTICQPEKKTCLFDVLTDPCELHDLANEMPHHIEVFKRWSLKHLSEVV